MTRQPLKMQVDILEPTIRDWTVTSRDWTVPSRDWTVTARDWTFISKDWKHAKDCRLLPIVLLQIGSTL